MPTPKTPKPAATTGRNADRRNGKGPKKNPGVSPKAHNGKTVGGYAPQRIATRAATRRLYQAVPSGE